MNRLKVLVGFISFVIILSCNRNEAIGTKLFSNEIQQEISIQCNFQNVSQLHIDTFIVQSFDFAIKVLKNPTFEENYQIVQKMNPISVEFLVNELQMDTLLLRKSYFKTISTQAISNQNLKSCLIDRAIELGFTSKFEREIGVYIGSRKCSFGFVAGHVLLAALEVGIGCESIIGCALGLSEAAHNLHMVYCCWHC